MNDNVKQFLKETSKQSAKILILKAMKGADEDDVLARVVDAFSDCEQLMYKFDDDIEALSEYVFMAYAENNLDALSDIAEDFHIDLAPYLF